MSKNIEARNGWWPPRKEKKMITNQDKIFDAIKINFWDVYESSTTKLSNICRQLAFAEGGICWFFITQKYALSCSTNNISWILIFLVLFFLFDALQYLASSIIYAGAAYYYEYRNRHDLLKNTKDVDRRWYMNIFPLILFLIKLFLITMASCFLIQLLLKQ